MASNTHTFSFKTRDSRHLKLEGDFDGNSAYELLETLKKYDSGSYQIFPIAEAENRQCAKNIERLGKFKRKHEGTS